MLQIENTIRGLIRVEGLKIGRIHRNNFSAKVEGLCISSPEIWQATEPLLRARDVMRSELKMLNLSLECKARNYPVCRLFMTIPGVGPLTSLAFKSTIDDPHRFKSSKLVPAHPGLIPRVYQSGEIDRSGHISKSGDKLLRYHLVNAAASMLMISGKWCSIKAWGVRLAKKKGKAKAIIDTPQKFSSPENEKRRPFQRRFKKEVLDPKTAIRQRTPDAFRQMDRAGSSSRPSTGLTVAAVRALSGLIGLGSRARSAI